MQHYLEVMSTGIDKALGDWPDRLRFYPAIKRLTLELAAGAFLGLPLGGRADAISRAFVEMLGASTALVRRPIPGNALWRGMRARERLVRFFLDEIPRRRGGGGSDIFTTICNARDDGGSLLSDRSIIDHMSLLLMAAHDTTTSALTSTVYMLGAHPEWQDRVRDEHAGWRDRFGQWLGYDGLRDLPITEMVLSETLRCMPPIPSLPRGLVKDVEFAGHVIPAGTSVGIHLLHTHHLEEHWPEPARFDPLRFTPDRQRDRHKYAWVQFGGGAHMCLGLHFAYMQSKLFLFALLRQRRIRIPAGYTPAMQWLPIARPKDGLPVGLERC
jgi:cytochrome P450